MRRKSRKSWWLPAAVCMGVTLGSAQAAQMPDPTPQQSLPVSQETPEQPPPVSATAAEPVGATPAATALTPSGKGDSAPESVVGATPKESTEPRVWYLPDPEHPGRYQPVVGFSLEDFRRAWAALRGLDGLGTAPRYTLDHLELDGVAEARLARFKAGIHVRVDPGGWVRIPLRLGEATLLEPPVCEGTGQSRLEFTEAERMWVAWLQNDKASEWHIRLRFVAPLEIGEPEQRLRLTLPAAHVSRIQIEVPTALAQARLLPGAVLTESLAMPAGGTRFAAQCSGGDFEIAWSSTASEAEGSPDTLECSGRTVVSVDAGRYVAAATLVVSNGGRAFDRFRVRLPVGAQWIPGDAPEYRTSLEARKADEAATETGRVVEVQFPEPTRGPVEVQLRAELQSDRGATGFGCVFSCFEVVAARQQVGHVVLLAPREMQVSWDNLQDLVAVDPSFLPADLQWSVEGAAFEYRRLPAALRIRVRPRESLLVATPRYRVDAQTSTLRLQGTVRYTHQGGELTELLLDPAGWQIDEVGPGGMVALVATPTEDGLLRLTLERPLRGEFLLELKAHRAVAEGSRELDLRFPIPVATRYEPFHLVVQPADNVSLRRVEEQTLGLREAPAGPAAETPTHLQPPLALQGDVVSSRLVAEWKPLPRRVEVSALSRLQIQESHLQIEQTFVYRVFHEPLTELALDLPRTLAERGTWEWRLDGAPLPPPILSGDAPADDSPATRIRVPLAVPKLGEMTLQIRRSVPLERIESDASLSLTIPLVTAADGELATNELELRAVGNLRIQGNGPPGWQPANSADPGEVDEVLRWTSVERQPFVMIGLNRESLRGDQRTVVEAVWLQSWLGSPDQQDRAVYRLTTAEANFRVRPPLGAVADGMTALVDAVAVRVRTAADGWWDIPLRGAGHVRSHVVDLQYRVQRDPRPRGACALIPPGVEAGVWCRRTNWQVLLPPQEHLLACPAEYLADYSWRWQPWLLARVPLLDDRQLEVWSGATPRDLLPAQANRYVFSLLGPPLTLHLQTARRSVLVAWGSGALLTVSLLWLHVPRLRHPGLLLVIAVMLLALAWIEPEPAILLGQGSLAGLCLAGFALWLERRASDRRQRPPAAGGSNFRQPGVVPSPRSRSAISPPREPTTTLAPAASESMASVSDAGT